MRLPSTGYNGLPSLEKISMPIRSAVLAAVAVVAFVAVGYGVDSYRSQSEREGVVTQTEAENDVIPSLPPE